MIEFSSKNSLLFWFDTILKYTYTGVNHDQEYKPIFDISTEVIVSCGKLAVYFDQITFL